MRGYRFGRVGCADTGSEGSGAGKPVQGCRFEALGTGDPVQDVRFGRLTPALLNPPLAPTSTPT